ncbi:MAG: A/G-specific adenine glycosylase [Calditrichia bacterium]
MSDNLIPEIKTFRQNLLNWYKKHRRPFPWRKSDDPYEIWVSEVMLQQTQAATALTYFPTFIARFPTLRRLASADQQEVLKAWEKMGYYARARNLHRAAQIILNEHSGKIPTNYSEFKKLPGVGEYIAAAVMSIAFNQSWPVVDGNVKRVLARLLRITEPVNGASSKKVWQNFAGQLLHPEKPGDFNQAMMELGSLICKPKNPDCVQCPVKAFCTAYRQGVQSDYPKRRSTPPVPAYRIAVGIVQRNGKMLITRRRPEGLLGGLWEFPGGKIESEESPARACNREIREETGVDVQVGEHLLNVKHAYSHFKVRLEVFACHYVQGTVRLNGPVDYRWVGLEELDAYPFPAATHKIIAHLRRKSSRRQEETDKQ